MSDSASRKALSLRHKALRAVGLSLLVFFVVIALSGVAWWQWIHAVPNVSIPAPILPSPNAYDEYVAASTMVTGASDIGAAVSKDPSASTYTPEARARLLEQNATALRKLREAFRYECLTPAVRSDRAFPEYGPMRDMARLLRLEGQLRAVRGDRGGALDSSLDAIRLGVDIERGAVMIGSLVSIAIRAIGSVDGWENAGHVTPSQARAGAMRLEAILDRRVSYADVLREEKYFGQAVMIARFRTPGWRRRFFGDMNEITTAPGAPPERPRLPSGEQVAMTFRLYSLATTGSSTTSPPITTPTSPTCGGPTAAARRRPSRATLLRK